MKKLLLFAVITALILVCFSSCSGYNKVMRDYLSDSENYQTYEVILADIYYRDPVSHEIVRDFENSSFSEHEVTFSINFFENAEDLIPFLGGKIDSDADLDAYEIHLYILADNNKILYENGFYENISLGEKIKVTTSNWIYMDSEFFYVAQVEYQGSVYLSFEDGLKNIIELMDKNKSLF